MKSLIVASMIFASTAFGRADDVPAGTSKPAEPVQCDAPYHAYWLSAAKDGNRAEYQRLLVTHGPVERLGGHTAWSALPFDNMALTFQTYRRDSLWDRPFTCVQQFGDVDAKGKSVVVDEVTYSYESCPLKDVVRLMEHPTGSIAIHRRVDPLGGAKLTAKAFSLILKEQLQAEE